METVRTLNNIFLSSPFWVLSLAHAFLSQHLKPLEHIILIEEYWQILEIELQMKTVKYKSTSLILDLLSSDTYGNMYWPKVNNW